MFVDVIIVVRQLCPPVFLKYISIWVTNRESRTEPFTGVDCSRSTLQGYRLVFIIAQLILARLHWIQVHTELTISPNSQTNPYTHQVIVP